MVKYDQGSRLVTVAELRHSSVTLNLPQLAAWAGGEMLDSVWGCSQERTLNLTGLKVMGNSYTP